MKRAVSLYLGAIVRVNHPESWYHGCQGTVLGRGYRWGHLLVEIIRNGKRYTPEIKRGHLEPVQVREDTTTP